jgi:hypothetical protein
MSAGAVDLTGQKGKACPGPWRGAWSRLWKTTQAYWLFCVPLGEVLEPEAPEDPLEPLPDAEPEDGLDEVSLDPELLELELGEDEVPEPELELGLDGVALDEDEDELGELGVVALPDIEPDPDAPGERFVASLDEPDEDDPEVAPELAPRFASPAGRSQPYRPPTAMARGSRTNADFLSMESSFEGWWEAS